MRFAALPCEILVWSLLRLFWLTPDVALTIQVRVMAFPEDNGEEGVGESGVLGRRECGWLLESIRL